jgi:hypothetical protein
MDRNQIRSVVSEQFFRSLAESGTSITAIPQVQLQVLANAIADGVFAALDAVEDEAMGVTPVSTVPVPGREPEDMPSPGTTIQAGSGEETILWAGRPYLTIGTRYELTTQRVRIMRGILGHTIEEIELIRVKDTKVNQHMGERMLNVGDITVISADSSAPEIVLHNVRHPVEVRELIRRAMMDEKNRRGMYYREEIGGEGQDQNL